MENKQIEYTLDSSFCRIKQAKNHVLNTVVYTVGTHQNLPNFDLVDVYQESHCIQHVETQKLHSIIVDKTLSWDKQIDSDCLISPAELLCWNILRYM